MVVDIFHFYTKIKVPGWLAGWLAGWLTDYSAAPWPILQAETCQIFSQAEIPRWAECGKMIFMKYYYENDGYYETPFEILL